MKFVSSFICLLCLVGLAKAQKPAESILPVDEHGKFIYYEVVNTKIPKDSLKIRAVGYLKKQNKELKYKSAQGDTAFVASGKIIINKTLLVVGHPSGEVLFDFQVEIRDGKYRFWLTDFNFIPYQRDRYGNFVASTSIGTPLENEPGKLNNSQWKEYQVQTTQYAKELAAKFKVYMASKAPVIAPSKEKTVVKKEW
ncbi:hypothetical protein EZ428_22260 [Pedobacter frigiditerrae]|uniref:DUF4468 domain-containing protein n=1 Tax=Pedobacter frigiditerrae TaxID=2530452 RepID=A0A4R0ML72_9SPHI|nr:hypothetical protein [Pedobacter frigiditerrae]TCC86932.1 hypothetical protein EZ428_22260 [Pedobacter frigiditerrae]